MYSSTVTKCLHFITYHLWLNVQTFSASAPRALGSSRHQRVQLMPPAKCVDQCLHAADHVTQLHYVLRPPAPGEGSHQVPVDEKPRHRAAHRSCKASKGLHLQAKKDTMATLGFLSYTFSVNYKVSNSGLWTKFGLHYNHIWSASQYKIITYLSWPAGIVQHMHR